MIPDRVVIIIICQFDEINDLMFIIDGFYSYIGNTCMKIID